MTMVML